MTTVLDLIADAAPTLDDAVYVINDPGGVPTNRRVTLGALATLFGVGGSYVALTGAQAVAGVKTFTDAPIVPAEVFGVAWNGKNEPPTKNDVYDKLVSLPTLATHTPTAITLSTVGSQTFVDFIGSASGVFLDTGFTLQDNLDTTKQVQFQLSGIATGNTRTLTVPDRSGEIVITAGIAQTLSGKTLDAITAVDGVSRTVSVASSLFASVVALNTVTLDFTPAYRLSTFGDQSTTIYNQTAAASGATSSDNQFAAQRVVKNATGVALSLGNVRPFSDATTIQGDAAAVTAFNVVSYRTNVLFGILGGGTLAPTSYSAFQNQTVVGPGVTITTMNSHASAPTIPGGVVTTLTHYKANNIAPTAGGSLGTLYGVSIDAMSGATTLNMGLRNAAAMQFPITARTISAVGDSLVSTTAVLATRYELTNSTGGSLTLTSAPTLPDGVDGQVVTFVNVGAQNIVIQDQGTLALSNLRLQATTRTLGPRDSIRLAWSTGIGDWVEEFFANVL